MKGTHREQRVWKKERREQERVERQQEKVEREQEKVEREQEEKGLQEIGPLGHGLPEKWGWRVSRRE